jgi:tetratricopeptide (TPR) repeat protein
MVLVSIYLLLQAGIERAEQLLRGQDVAGAKAAVTETLDAQPESVAALMLRGRIAMAESDFDLARQVLGKAASLAPGKPGPQFLLGFFHYVDNDFVRARPVLEKARKLAPADPQAALFLALTYEGLALPDLARAQFEQAIKLEDSARHPTAGTRLAYARMLYTQGLYPEAQSHVAHALRLEPESRDAHYEQARLHFVNGNFQGCIEEASSALKLQGDGTTERSIHFLLSRAYNRLGDAAKSQSHRERFEAIPPRLIR